MAIDQIKQLTVSNQFLFLESYENLGKACARWLNLPFKSYAAHSEAEALEAMAATPDISIVVCDTMPESALSRMLTMADLAPMPEQESLGPQIADKLREQYPTLRIVGVPCCYIHIKDWKENGRKYPLIDNLDGLIEQYKFLLSETPSQ